MDTLLKRIAGHQNDMEVFLEQMVNVDSGADCPEGTEVLAHKIGEKLQSIGFEVSYPGGPVPDAPVHVLGTRKGTSANPKNIMIIGHHDTVFTKGAAAARPFTKKDGKAYGPGVLDMKSGITIALFALQSLTEEKWSEHNLTVFFFGDEEVGHPKTDAREMLMERAKNMDAVFNMETGADSGTVVVGRKGCIFVGLRVDGIAAHSGKDPEKGASAIKELCYKVNELYKMNIPEKGVAFNAGKITGGIVANGIAPYAEFWGDVRLIEVESKQYALDYLQRVADEVHVPRTKTTVIYDDKRTFMPMEKTEANMKLYELVRAQGKKLGIDVEGVFVGGGSDSCWTTMAGAPTVCAMGARGELNHSEQEYIQLYSLTERAQLLALSIQHV